MQLGGDYMKKIRSLFSIKWWTKDYGVHIFSIAIAIIYFFSCFLIQLKLLKTIEWLSILQCILLSISIGLSMTIVYPRLIKHFIPPKKILLWWTNYYCVKIVSILFSILLFFVYYFGIFIYDEGWHGFKEILSTINAMAGGFIFAFIYYFIANAISTSKTKRSKNTDTEKIDRPKYLTVDWWKYDYCFRIVGSIVIFSSIVILSILVLSWCYADKISLTISIVLGYFAINVVLSIIIGVVVAFVYWVIASVISWVYQKIKGIKSEHISE